ncbi:Large cysteine-rich periplasmic protein omcB precursor [Rubripirellula amarantea]|uniref:Large cysteine-rich periplasmic protein omcB n=1 Tax=Rubripirellula amarantea TaxID=2527999 RepID=A0A5C5WF54_9BACT|nr:hypothetical protein [Rubripirellula amarantea]TWT49167.1 Large cysteine-rich periplasmic protein omcB precursor [Rubripirellula amarantea]
MKSFGLRLTAGIVTILFGAYAAALAQRDKQNDSQAWTAQAPSLGEPAAPIAGMNEDSWISQPAENLENASNSLADFAANAFSPPKGDVVLVQHTEDMPAAPGGFDMPGLPASLGEPAAQTMEETPAVNWGISEDATAPEVQTESSLSMGYASESPANQLDQLDAIEEPQPLTTTPGEANSLPTLSLAEPPQMNTFAAAPAQEEFNAEPAPSPMTANPSNDLRNPNTAMNELRSMAPPAMQSYEPESSYPEPMRPESLDRQSMQQPAPQSLAQQPQQQPLQQQPYAQQQLAQQTLAPPPQSFAGQTDMYGRPLQQLQQQPPPRMASLPTSPQSVPAITADTYGQRGYDNSGMLDIDPNTVTGSPGDRRLEGIQSPSVVIHKRAPAEVKVGKPAAFVIHVQNVGSAEALGVTVHDRVPAGMRLVDASPEPVMQGDLLMWQLGAMSAGEERTVTMQLVPEAEGELGSVARVTFEAAASVRTVSTRPELKIVQRAPEKVLIGQQLEIELEVSNPGTGDATGVALQEDVPEGLEHPRGRQLDNMLGTLAAGEVRQQVLRLRAASPGMVRNTIRLVSEDGLTAEHTIDVEVVAPNLEVELQGPSRRFLEHQTTYQLTVVNTGTADATNVEISVALDRGFTFVSTDYEGQYDPSRHAVYWSLASLPAGSPATVPLTLLPIEEGNRAITVDARADLNTMARNEHKVTVEGLADLSFQIINPGGPIEIGAESSYEITVNNSGSKTDTNVQVQVQLPPALELISADGDSGQASTDGRGIVAFPPRSQLAPGTEMKYRLRVRGVAPGTHLVKAVVMSDSAAVPVTKEESTLVYADQ